MVMLQRRVSSHRTGSVDLWLLIAPVLAALFGLVMVYTATQAVTAGFGLSRAYFAERQTIFVVAGIACMIVLSRIDYHRLESIATLGYVVTLLSLLGVMVVGNNALGATRWISVGGLQIQPSEFAILGIIVAIATYCARRPDGLSLRDISRVLLMAVVPIGLVFLQPDFGTAIIMGVCVFVMLIAAGVPLRILVALLLLVVGAVAIAIELRLLKSYQLLRLTSFLNQDHASSSSQLSQAVYNLQQSKIAIGNGGLFGAGIGHGTTTALGYVPEQQTDFIFSAIGEQFGFVGTVGILALLSSVAWRVLVAGVNARDTMGQVLCAGIFAFLAFSIVQNAGMAMGIMPVAGIPLPFISYGGTAIVCTFAGCGLAQSVAQRRGMG